jgi:hypothetical protein
MKSFTSVVAWHLESSSSVRFRRAIRTNSTLISLIRFGLSNLQKQSETRILANPGLNIRTRHIGQEFGLDGTNLTSSTERKGTTIVFKRTRMPAFLSHLTRTRLIVAYSLIHVNWLRDIRPLNKVGLRTQKCMLF